LVTGVQVKPFPFDRVFSEPSAKSRSLNEGALGARVTALEADLERMKIEQQAALAVARAEAFQEGLEQARGERDTALLAAVDALQASIETIEEGFGEIEARLAREASELAVAAADLIAAKALELDPHGPIDEAIGRALSQVRRGEPIQVRVHPDLVADIERLVSERQASERRRLSLTVRADATLSPGDVALTWEKGGLRLDAEARRAAIRDELDGILPTI